MGVSVGSKRQAECFLTHILMLALFHWIWTKMVCETSSEKKMAISKIRNAFVILTLQHTLIQTVLAINLDDGSWGNHVCVSPPSKCLCTCPYMLYFAYVHICALMFVLLINRQWRCSAREEFTRVRF